MLLKAGGHLICSRQEGQGAAAGLRAPAGQAAEGQPAPETAAALEAVPLERRPLETHFAALRRSPARPSRHRWGLCIS